MMMKLTFTEKCVFHSQVVNLWLPSRDHEFTRWMECSIWSLNCQLSCDQLCTKSERSGTIRGWSRLWVLSAILDLIQANFNNSATSHGYVRQFTNSIL